MKKHTVSVFFCFTGVIFAAFCLFSIVQQVQQTEARLKQVRNKVSFEKEALRVLEAEWHYLNRPEYLEAMAAQYLSVALPESAGLSRQMWSLQQADLPVVPIQKPDRDIRPIAFTRFDASSVVDDVVVDKEISTDSVFSVKPQKKPAFKVMNNENKFQSILSRVTQDSEKEERRP